MNAPVAVLLVVAFLAGVLVNALHPSRRSAPAATIALTAVGLFLVAVLARVLDLWVELGGPLAIALVTTVLPTLLGLVALVGVTESAVASGQRRAPGSGT